MSKEMYRHELNPVKGWWDAHALDLAALAVFGVGKVINKGAVMSLRSDGKLQLGLACNAMPIFAFNASFDFDAVPDAGGMVGPSNGGVALDVETEASMTGVVAIGGYELQSTEFDATYDASYVPNQALTAYVPGHAKAGQLKPGTQFTNTLCGVCSKGLSTSDAGIQVLQFWGVWIPQTECAGSSQHG